MLKKVVITAAAAAALSVSLPGVAWATPSDNNPPGHPSPGSTGPGIPHEVGAFGDAIGQNPNGTGQPVPPGQEFNIAKDAFPGVSTPVAVGEFVNGVYGSIGLTTDFGPTAPGLAVKSFTPACTSGHVAYDQNGTVSGNDLCH
jgi:hypothetical protein